MEKWLDIPGYEGIYRVSDRGRIHSLERTRKTKGGGVCVVPEKIILGTQGGFGYRHVTLRKNGRKKQYSMHQLVLLAFVGPCPSGMEGCHFPDNNPDNNSLGNLRYDSHANNNRDREYKKGEEHHAAKLTENRVRKIRRLWKAGWLQVHLAKRFGVRQTHISDIVHRKVWKHI